MNIPKTIQIYGDSIMRGTLFDPVTNRYYYTSDKLVEPIEAQLPIQIVNKARFGCTVEKGYAIIAKDMEKGIDCDAVLIEYGGNDCNFNWKEIAEHPENSHSPITLPEQFQTIYRKIITSFREKKIIPIIASLPPIDAERYFKWLGRTLNGENMLKWLGDVQVISRFQETYSQMISLMAKEMNCLFVDLRSAFLKKADYRTYMSEDGIHPNADGYQLIYQSFLHFFQRQIAIKE